MRNTDVYAGLSMHEPEVRGQADMECDGMDAIISQTWLTATEAAEYLKVKPRTVLMWARLGQLRGYTLCGTRRHVWRFKQVDLDDMMGAPSVFSIEGRR